VSGIRVLTFPRLRVGYLIPATLNRDHQAGEHARGVLVPTSMVPLARDAPPLPSELAPGYRYVPWLRRDPLHRARIANR
jgi:hypothetical protein